MDPVQLKEAILSYSLDNGPHGNQGYSRVLLQLFGFTGHGKSSFINSCKYVLDDSDTYTKYAVAGERSDGGAMTMERKSYELTENISIVDNRGYSRNNSLERAEIYAQLGNFIPIGEKVEWMDNYTDMMNRLQDAELNPNYSDFIVPILVHSASSMFTDSERKEVQTFMKNCVQMTGVAPIVVITKKESGNFIELENKFRQMTADDVIAIENYTEKDQIKTLRRTKDILTILKIALDGVRYRLTKGRDARKEWVERKKFMLDFIHNADQEKREAERRREEEREREAERKREAEREREAERRRAEEWRREEERIRAEERKKRSFWPWNR
ncbi:eukaryotic translation initiation factor 3 subunit A-like [Bufo gargarizans]|uniref:eukaryotic translation initiation factor 3 subunit A-like n=1 Tax=Bufo gargarizans TaxID=30331 RepID=UPI001CF46633|nr:eukaryotic translation initiation factor 3 subunit A-like [Bufo gargarizans]